MPVTVIQGCFPQGVRQAKDLPPHFARVPATAGQALPAGVRQRMESVFGADFRAVRVHVGSDATRIGAQAFTNGAHIHFAPGQYDPASARGLGLIAHELAHVVQQKTGRVRTQQTAGVAIVHDPSLEAEADRMRLRIASQLPAPPVQRTTHVPAHAPTHVQRAAAPRTSAPIQRQVQFSAPQRAGQASYRIAASVGGSQVGAVMVHERGRSTMEISDLAVAPDHRKQGLGNALMASALRTGQRLGKSMVVLASADNGSGRLTQWYQRMGFIASGRDARGLQRMVAPIGRILPAVSQPCMAVPSHVSRPHAPVVQRASSGFGPSAFPRPNFQAAVYSTATAAHNLFEDDDLDPSDPRLSSINAAVPHRMSWKDIRDNTIRFLNRVDDEAAFKRWTGRFLDAAGEVEQILQKLKDSATSTEEGEWCDMIMARLAKCVSEFKKHRSFVTRLLPKLYAGTETKATILEAAKYFLQVFNSYFPNVPDLGPHRGVNIQVSNRVHLNVAPDGSLSPMSSRVLDMTPGRTSGVAATPGHTHIVSTSGAFVPMTALSTADQARVHAQGLVSTSARETEMDTSS